MVRFRTEYNTLFALGLALIIGTAMLAPVMNAGLIIQRPWKPGYIEKYDLRPEAGMLIVLNVGHWSAVAAGCLGVLLILVAATALPWYAGVPLCFVGLCLGLWNWVSLSSRMW